MFRYMTLLFPLRLKDWICQLFDRQGCWWVWLKNVEMPWSIKSRFLWAEKKNCYQLDLKMFWMELWWNGKGLAVLGLEKRGRHEHAGILKKACPRNCVLCDKVVVAYDWKMLNICETSSNHRSISAFEFS